MALDKLVDDLKVTRRGRRGEGRGGGGEGKREGEGCEREFEKEGGREEGLNLQTFVGDEVDSSSWHRNLQPLFREVSRGRKRQPAKSVTRP